jgi:hypothetical protein
MSSNKPIPTSWLSCPVYPPQTASVSSERSETTTSDGPEDMDDDPSLEWEESFFQDEDQSSKPFPLIASGSRTTKKRKLAWFKDKGKSSKHDKILHMS